MSTVNPVHGRFIVALLVSAVVLAGALGATAVKADSRLELIRQRGYLIVGVKADYPPWGYRSSDGKLVGFEPDLAKDVSRRIGVELKLVAVTAGNRLQKLEGGEIDLVIATLGDTDQRREVSGLLRPHYYASGVNILARSALNITDWGQLRGRAICLSEGAYFNRTLIERYLLEARIFAGTRDAKAALRDGRCSGWVFDDTSLIQEIRSGDWTGYGMLPESILVSPWSIAVKKTELESDYGKFLVEILADWHRSGLLLQRAKEWGLPANKLITEKHDLWTRKDETGRLICSRGVAGDYPQACIFEQTFGITGRKIEDDWIIRLTRILGIDFEPLLYGFDRRVILKGIRYTVALTAIAIVGSLLFAVLVALARSNAPLLLRTTISWFAAIFRLIPPLLQIYIVFFGIGGFVISRYGWTLDAFVVSAVAFCLYAGSSNAAELSQELDTLQSERSGQSVWRLLPSAIDRSFEGLVANCVNIVKAVAIASTIAVPELISATNAVIAEHGNAAAMMNFLMVFYFLFVCLTLWVLKRLRRLVGRWAAHTAF